MMAVKARFIGREALNKKLRALVPNIDEEVEKAQLAAAQDLAKDIAARAPLGEDGDYRRSISAEVLPERKAAGVFAAWYWRFIEFGTRPHKIRGRSGRNLRFIGLNGRWVSKRIINHPGAGRRPHIFPTFREKRRSIRMRIGRAIGRAVRKAMK